MKPGQSKLRTKPPSRSSDDQAETLARLNALESWTEEPARDVAAVIDGTEMQQEPPKPPPARKRIKDEVYPWQKNNDALQEAGVVLKPMNIRAPIELYHQLKWLSDNRVNGMNLTRIIIEALQEKADKMLKERGIK